MKHHKNDIAAFYCEEGLMPYISGLCSLVKSNPFILGQVRGIDDKAKEIFQQEGFQLFSTVAATTLLYNKKSDCFFKILHPLNVRNRLLFYFFNRPRQIFSLSAALRSHGVRVPEIPAYGNFRIRKLPFFAMKRIEGKSLYDYLVREGSSLPPQTYFNVIDKVAELHRLGYWLGDAHLSHIFIKDNEVSGFIDIDSIRKNTPFSLNKSAKDLAGLNHPELSITKDERIELLNYYLQVSEIKNKDRFKQLVKYYTERRWKG